MMQHLGKIVVLLISFFAVNNALTQETPSPLINLQKINQFTQGIIQKYNQLQDKVTRKTNKALIKLQKQEAKLYRKLAKKDSTAAKQLFAEQQEKYQAMQQKINSGEAKKLKQYIPHFDTVKSSLAYLEKQIGLSNETKQQIMQAKEKLQLFETKMQAANEIKRQIRERKQQLVTQLQQYGMGKELTKMKKEVYYYQQQLEEYKAILKDPKKFERKAISLLKENKLFKEFMKKNSVLAQLFKLPEDYGTAQNLAGLQTRNSINTLLNQRIASSGMSVQQAMQGSVNAARNQLQSLRNRVNSLGGNSSNIDMPDFKPNTQKTKTFWKRLEYGMNFQTVKSKYMLPVTTDIGLSAGYKLNDNSVIGVGGSYKLGWGKDIRHISMSHQGIGFRSYVDMKLKGNFWISGGYEQNYQHEFTKYSQLQNLKAWQQSGLIGLTKKYKLGNKIHTLQILWDFLSYQQYPRTEAIKFRVGYKF